MPPIKIIGKIIREAVPVRVLLWGALIFIFILNFFKPHWLDMQIAHTGLGSWLENAYYSINENIWMAWATMLFLFLILSFLCIHYFGRRICKSLGITFLLFSLWVGLDKYWIYPDIYFNAPVFGGFRWIFVGSFLITSVILFVSVFFKIKNSKETTPRQIEPTEGFSTDYSDLEISKSKEWERYATLLVNRICNTPLSKEAFAVGIAGEWGSGKSIFLSYIEKAFPDDTIVMKFNPWENMSENSLVTDFFSQLSQIVENNIDPDLRYPLESYADALISLEGSGGWIDKLRTLIFGSSEKNIKKLKQKIGELLEKRGRRIYILIDDFDRLEKNEIIEVLRLIRNTGDFPNIAYIVAYDRDYVADMLKANSIGKGDVYLEKIFNTEINIPKSTPEQLHGVFINELSKMGSELAAVDKDWIQFPSLFLNTFRQVKRFARTIVVVNEDLKANISEDEFDKRDMMTLELIRMCDPKMYEEIKLNWAEMFDVCQSPEGFNVFAVKKIEMDDSLPKYHPRRLLYYLFNENHNYRNTIRYVNNFYRYMTYSLSPNHITNKEILEWAEIPEDTDDEAKLKISELKKRANKHYTLLFQLSFIPDERINAANSKRIFDIIIEYYLKSRSNLPNIELYIKNIFKKFRNIPHDHLMTFFNYVISYFEKQSFSEAEHLSLSQLITSLRQNIPEFTEHFNKCAIANFNNYLNSFHPDAYEFVDKKSYLQKIYTNSIYYVSLPEYSYEIDTLIQTKIGKSELFEPMLNYFSKHKSSRKKEFNHDLFIYEDIIDGEVVELYVDEEEGEKIINRVFGNQDYYNSFIEKAFEEDNPPK